MLQTVLSGHFLVTDTFSRSQLKISIVRTLKEDQPPRLLLNLLIYHFNRPEPTYKSQRISAFHAMHYKQHFPHVSLETEYNAVRVINYTILRG